MSSCPVVINSFNQPTYLRLMIEQLRNLDVKTIIVVDHASTSPELQDYLDLIRKTVTVIKLRENLGPHWFFVEGLALSMPEFFAYTDADLKFNESLPHDFLSQLISVAAGLHATKVGLALDISKSADMISYGINIGGKNYTNIEWERQFWTKPVRFKNYELYEAPVDTTFAVYQRKEFDSMLMRYMRDQVYDCMDTPRSYRIAGEFCATHLPWSRSDPMPREELNHYTSTRINVHKY
jgi:glycosyltransferase involved in cell wall biosynthesis